MATTIDHAVRFTTPLLTAALLVATPAFAVDFTWNVAGGGDFNDANNWAPAGGPPTTGDVAVFDNETTGTVALSADRTVNHLSFRNDSGALVLDLGGFNLNLAAANGFQMATADTHVNDITVTNGTLTTNATGNGISWSVPNVQNNTLTFTGASTLVTGTSTSSSLIGTGAGSAGNVLSVLDGATVSMANNFLLGPISTTASTNQINVTDATLNVTNGNRGIALQSGTLNITRGVVSAGYLGAATDGQVPTYGGSVNFNSGELSARRVRMIGEQTLVIGDGGTDAADFRMILSGPFINAPGGVHVSANGSLGGVGTVDATVTADAGAELLVSAEAPTGTRTLTINGDLDAVGLGITLKLGDFPFERAQDEALLQPFEVPVQTVAVNGNFSHGGSVTFDLSDYVAPDDMDYEYKAIGWTTQSGNPLDTVVAFTGGSPLTYDLRSDGLYVTAALVAGLLGDFDSSGVLDLPDINLLMDEVQAGTNTASFDLTTEGNVDLADRDEWVLNLFGSSGVGDVNLDGSVTALGDFSPALGNLGAAGTQNWEDGDVNGDDAVTALGDLSVILSGLGSEPPAPGSDAASDAALDAPAPGTAVAEYDPNTGVITIRANQVALLAITSDGENLVAGTQTGNFAGFAATDFPNLGEVAWVASANILGGVIPGQDTVGVSVTPGTALSDLTLLYQIAGSQLTEGVITLIPEPASLSLLALAGLALRRRRVA